MSGKVLQEFRVAAQVAGDFHRVQSVLEAHFGHAFHSPSKTNCGRTGHPQRRSRRRPSGSRSVPPGSSTAHVGVEFAAPAQNRNRRARAGAAGQRRAGAALPHAQAHARAIDDLYKADIAALWKSAHRSTAPRRASPAARSRRRRLRSPRADCPSTRRRIRHRRRSTAANTRSAAGISAAECLAARSAARPCPTRTRPSSSTSTLTGPDGLYRRVAPDADRARAVQPRGDAAHAVAALLRPASRRCCRCRRRTHRMASRAGSIVSN